MVGLTIISNANVRLSKLKKQKQTVTYGNGDVVGKIVRETPTMYVTDTGVKLQKLCFGNDICNGVFTTEFMHG